MKSTAEVGAGERSGEGESKNSRIASMIAASLRRFSRGFRPAAFRPAADDIFDESCVLDEALRSCENDLATA
jgi:hypothetical protein